MYFYDRMVTRATRLASKVLKPMKFRIKVISGQFLPKPAGDSSSSELIDPYVVVEIIGLDIDAKTVSRNGQSLAFLLAHSRPVFSVQNQDCQQQRVQSNLERAERILRCCAR